MSDIGASPYPERVPPWRRRSHAIMLPEATRGEAAVSTLAIERTKAIYRSAINATAADSEGEPN